MNQKEMKGEGGNGQIPTQGREHALPFLKRVLAVFQCS